jgi:hypothetical protein
LVGTGLHHDIVDRPTPSAGHPLDCLGQHFAFSDLRLAGEADVQEFARADRANDIEPGQIAAGSTAPPAVGTGWGDGHGYSCKRHG